MGEVTGCVTLLTLCGAGTTEEMTMTRSIVVGLAVLALSTSAAFAAHRHHHAMHASYSGVAPAAPAMWMGGASSNDHAMYLKNERDAGYNPKNDYTANGLLKNQ